MIKNQGKRNREVGHRYERLWAKRFRDKGFTYCKTSRQASRLLDDCGVDLAFIPFLFQCKNVQAGINYGKLITDIETKTKAALPPNSPELKNPIVIAHKKAHDELIIMKADDFLELIKKINWNAENKD